MRFTKLQGTGNDFIVLNNLELNLAPGDFPALARHLCRRRVSLGGDALMVADRPEGAGDFRMRFYNADGTEAEMCGNGARCIARFAYQQGLAGPAMTIETVAGPVLAWREDARRYKIRLNHPTVLELHRPVQAQGQTWDCAYVELGDPGIPHAVVHLPGLAGMDAHGLRPLGAALRGHPGFPKGANVNFYDMAGENQLAALTYERGVEDFTLACGTGSGAVAAVATLLNLAPGPTVHLQVPGGDLWVEVGRRGAAISALHLLGDTNQVCQGEVTDEDLFSS